MIDQRQRAPRRIFVFLGAQHDNIGDALLRRRLLRALRGEGEIHAFIGSAPEDFEEALEFSPSDFVYQSFTRWWWTATRVSVRRRSSAYVLNAGEITPNRHDGMWHAALVPALVVGRLRGNPGVRAGIGARGRYGLWQWPIAATVRLCRYNAWRDEYSRDLFQKGIVAPDWAFDEGRRAEAPASPRPHIALGYRSDKKTLSEAAATRVKSWADRRGLTPVVVSQVERDVDANDRLAKMLGAPHIGRDACSLLEREKAARKAYATSTMVLSNRIHALILAASEGALPAGLMQHADIKVGRTMAAAGLDGYSLVIHDTASDLDRIDPFLDGIIEHAGATHAHLDRAATRVGCMEQDLRRILEN